jgi:hypothetical protein
VLPGTGEPTVLYHGSQIRELPDLRSRDGRLYATDDIRLASTFLADPEYCFCSRSAQGKVTAFIAERREDFIRRDQGGTIYLVDARCFRRLVPRGGERSGWEWTAPDTVRPLSAMNYASALLAMMAFGVSVHFVGYETFNAIKTGEDVRRLEYERDCENRRLELFLMDTT